VGNGYCYKQKCNLAPFTLAHPVASVHVVTVGIQVFHVDVLTPKSIPSVGYLKVIPCIKFEDCDHLLLIYHANRQTDAAKRLTHVIMYCITLDFKSDLADSRPGVVLRYAHVDAGVTQFSAVNE